MAPTDGSAELEAGRLSAPVTGHRWAGRSPWRWAGWLAGMATIGLAFGLAMVFVLKFINDPVQASTLTLKQARASVAPSPTPTTINLLGGLYVELPYSRSFDMVGQVKTDNAALEQYTLGSKGNYRHTITVDVRTLPSGSLTDDASYRLRQLQSAVYAPSLVTVGGEAATLMTKNDHSEQTLFWPHQGKLLTVAVTSTDPADNVVAIMKTITAGARWRK
jgi:hypothetical protein